MGLNFMLIDDSEMDLAFSQAAIESVVDDAEILTFIRAEQAISYLGSLGERQSSDFMIIPDIILLDIHMPGMDGFDFLDAFHDLNDWKLQSVQIYILSTSWDMKQAIKEKRHMVCHGFIDKPLTGEMVQRAVDGLHHLEYKNI